MPGGYRLGCPIWANRAWLGNLYPKSAKADELLSWYASVFDAVEGNSTFYALPSADTVAKWCEQAPSDFHFCFKFPRTITHEAQLEGAVRETDDFFERMSPMGTRLGPFMLQLPPSFHNLDRLAEYLEKLPSEFRYAVEVRHRSFFGGPKEVALDRLLEENGIARCSFDTRALFAVKVPDAMTRATQTRKPRVPARYTVTGGQPFLRFIGQDDVRATSGYLQQIAERIVGWLDEGLTPYVFMHSPDDFFAPRHARALHYLLGKLRPQAPLSFPGEEQLPLFS